MLKNYQSDYLHLIHDKLRGLNLEVSQLCTSTDFTHPDPTERVHQKELLKNLIVVANEIGANAVRFVTGQAHPNVKKEDGIDWIVQGLEEIVRFAEPYGIQIRLENHYRDKSVWELPDFTHKAEVFFQLYDRIQDTPVMINYDCSNPLMCGDDPLEILHKVKKKVVSVHASDRKRGSYQHSVIGEGEVPFDDIFQVLSESGFTGWISAEDGNPKGDEGFFKSLEFLRAKLDEYWPS
jgi:sugar phosphate isomerase/epimerase